MKGIKFKIVFEGEGCVNYDSIENQLGVLNKIYKKEGKFEKNTLVMKKVYYEQDGELKQIPIIDENKLRYYIFGEQISSYDAANKNIAMKGISKWETLTRGHTLILNKSSEQYNLHRKGGFHISNAYLINDAKPQFTIQTHNVIDLVTEKRSSTSMFNVETIGKTLWEAEGNFDVFELQFISASQQHDRMSVFPDWVSSGEFQEFINMEFGAESKPLSGYFYANRNNRHPEYGVLLNNEIVIRLIKNTLIKLIQINANSRTGHIETKSLKIKVYDDIASLDDKNEGWIDIRSIDDIEKLDLSGIHNFYTKVSDDVVEDYLSNLEKLKNEINNEENDLTIAEGV